MATAALMNAYTRLDTTFVKGRGARLWDEGGREYLDALSGIAVCGLGHAHPAVTRALCEQAETLTHTSNIFHNQPQERLAEQLCKLAGMDNVFFGNSGAEANEAALKIARKYGHQQGIETPTVIVMAESFHGRTMATLSATGNPKVKEGFEPLLPGFVQVPYNDLAAVEKLAANDPNVVAIFVEPIQGEGGINVPASDYLKRLREICDQHNWLLMLDEIQTGMGRTGRFLACQHSGVEPDVATLAKGLGNGFPIGACLARDTAAGVIQPGNHGSTFGGNPLACHTAEAVLQTLVDDGLMERAAALGERIMTGLRDGLADCPAVVDIRGKGLMIGAELNRPCGEIVQRALDKGVVLNVTAGQVVRLLPPLIYTDREADTLVDTLVEVIGQWSQETEA